MMIGRHTRAHASSLRRHQITQTQQQTPELFDLAQLLCYNVSVEWEFVLNTNTEGEIEMTEHSVYDNEVVEFKNIKARGGRSGTKRLDCGSTLYAVRNKLHNLYFIWCYTDKQSAEAIARRIYPGSNNGNCSVDMDISVNWRKDIQVLTHCDTKTW